SQADETTRAARLRQSFQFIDFLLHEFGSIGHDKTAHAAAAFKRLLHHAKLGARKRTRKIDELHGVARIGFVAAEATHRLRVRKTRERRREISRTGGAEHLT